MTHYPSIEAEIRDRGFDESDHTRAWLGYWFAIWIGTVSAGGIAGTIIGAIFSLIDINSLTPIDTAWMITAYGVLGLIWSATTGSFFLAITAMYVWMFRSYHDPVGLASIVGGLSGFFCFPLFIPLTLPMGIAGAWLAVKIYLRMDTALPMVLFNQLREEQRREKLDRW